MRRHTLFLSMWLLLIVLLLTPVVEAAGCVPGGYNTYLPYIASSQPEGTQYGMGQFSIIQPKSTVNLVTNPSIEAATTNYTSVSSSIARSSAKQRRSGWSLAVTPTSTTSAGVYYGTVSTTSGQDYTFSVDVWAPVGVLMHIFVGSTGGAQVSTPTEFVGTGKWVRIENTYTESSSTTRRLYVTKSGDASTAVFYIDGVQFENLAYATTYCDGYQKGCSWTAAVDGSTSQRTAQERSGGKLINLESLNAYLVSQQGTGMPNVGNIYTPYASIDGAFYQGRTVNERNFTIAMSVSGSSVQDWHAKRQAFIDLIKPDLVYPIQPFILVYDGGGTKVQMSCYYDGGFEMADGKREIETIAIRCLAVDPFWKFDGNAGTALNVSTTISNANGIVVRSQAGVWSALTTGVSGGNVYAVEQGLDGTYYVGGSFTSAGGVANTRAIAKYNPVTGAWSAMGSGGNTVGDEVNGMAIAPNGDVWVIGRITDMGGVASADSVARWDGSAWNGVGTAGFIGGAVGFPLHPCFGDDGQFYMPTFGTTIKRWDGSAWTTIGTSGGSFTLACALAPDGTIVVAHNGTTISAVSTPALVGRWDPATSTWSGVGLTSYNTPTALVFDTSGKLYAAAGNSSSNLIAYNGYDWEPVGQVGTGATTPYALDATLDGRLLIGGTFTTAGGITLYDRFAESNGSVIIPPDIDLPGTATVYTISTLRDGNTVVGFNTTGTATAAATTTVTNNGTATAFPKITISGPSSGSAIIRQIVNKTTGKAIYLKAVINAGETMVLDLTPGAISFTSNFQQNLMSKILPGSALSNWGLIPGDNTISMLIGSTTATAVITWPEKCWSVDASGS